MALPAFFAINTEKLCFVINALNNKTIYPAQSSKTSLDFSQLSKYQSIFGVISQDNLLKIMLAVTVLNTCLSSVAKSGFPSLLHLHKQTLEKGTKKKPHTDRKSRENTV